MNEQGISQNFMGCTGKIHMSKYEKHETPRLQNAEETLTNQ